MAGASVATGWAGPNRPARGIVAPVRVLATDGGDGPVNAYGGTGLMNQMITLAGGVNVLADVAEDSTEVSAEKVAASSPAAQQRRFLGVPAAAAHSGYRNILEIREIARFLHPDAFS